MSIKSTNIHHFVQKCASCMLRFTEVLTNAGTSAENGIRHLIGLKGHYWHFFKSRDFAVSNPSRDSLLPFSVTFSSPAPSKISALLQISTIGSPAFSCLSPKPRNSFPKPHCHSISCFQVLLKICLAFGRLSQYLRVLLWVDNRSCEALWEVPPCSRCQAAVIIIRKKIL